MSPLSWLRAALIGAFAAAVLLQSIDAALAAAVGVAALELMRMM